VRLLIDALPERRVVGAPPPAVSGLTADSRRVEPGDCFVAVPGFKQDARRFVRHQRCTDSPVGNIARRT